MRGGGMKWIFGIAVLAGFFLLAVKGAHYLSELDKSIHRSREEREDE